MDVSCPACSARYTADDEKLRGKTARMRCKACSTVWLVSGPGATPLPDHAKAAALASPPKASLNSTAALGSNAGALMSRIPTPAPASASTAGFGSIAPPPSPMFDDPAPVIAKRAAVVKTGADREKRDLFAETGDEDMGRVKETLLPPPSFGFNGGVGARNENSVLFRVDQLSPASVAPPKTERFKQSAAPVDLASRSSAAPAAAAAVASNGYRASDSSDEGVIDLKALSSAPPGLRPVGLPVAPLFSEPPGVSYDTDDSGRHSVHGGKKKKKASKLVFFGGIAAAAAFLLVAGFGVSLAFKGEPPVKRDAPVVAAPPPAAAAIPSPAKTAEQPPPVASADKTDDTETKGKKGKKGKKSGKGKKSSGPITDKTPPPTQKPVKAADPCGCKGDFNCILACTVKK